MSFTLGVSKPCAGSGRAFIVELLSTAMRRQGTDATGITLHIFHNLLDFRQGFPGDCFGVTFVAKVSRVLFLEFGVVRDSFLILFTKFSSKPICNQT